MDPKDCHNPVCGSKIEMFNSSMANLNKAGAVLPPKADTNVECPVDRDELGRSTWNLVRLFYFFIVRTKQWQLHTTAAYFPEMPTTEDVQRAEGMIKGLAQQ